MPFALLLDSVAPSQAAKPDKKDTRDSDQAIGTDDAKQSAGQNTQPDSAAPVAVQAKSGTDKPEKSHPGKSDRDDDGIPQPDSDPQSNRISAADPQPAETLTFVPAPTLLSVPPTAIAAPSDNDAGHMPIDPAAPTHNDACDSQAAAAAPAQISAADAAAQASADSATAQASAAAAMASAAPAATQAPAAPPTTQAPLDPLTTQVPAASVAAAPAIAQANPATSQTSAASAQASVTSEEADDAATQIQAAAQTLAAVDTRVPATKTDTAKPPKAAQNVKAVPADNSKTDATQFSAPDKTEDLKPNVPEAASNDTPKPAPQPAANNSATGIASPQAPQALLQSGAAPAITQHVQVTAQPVPNLPALAVTIAAKSQSGARQFDIRLDPPELGRVDVRLSIDASGKTSAHLSADQLQTLHLLQKDASVLTRALRDAGLNVAQDGLNFSLRQQTHDGGAGNHNRGASRAFSATATISLDATIAGTAIRGPLDGRLDIRV